MSLQNFRDKNSFIFQIQNEFDTDSTIIYLYIIWMDQGKDNGILKASTELKSVLNFVRKKTLDLSCKMCRMCVRSRSCDFYVKLKRTCKTLISLPFVCNNGTQENIGLKVDITSSKTINNSINITRVIIGEDFIRVFVAINVGKNRIRHGTTLNSTDVIFNRL